MPYLPNPIYKALINEHPYTREMLGALNQFGVDGLLHSNTDMRRQQSNVPNDFLWSYGPSNVITTPYPETDYDFSFSGSYSIYNWEIFFHSVSLIARQLRLNNKYAEAIRWLNYIFDPADPDDPNSPLLDLRYWQIKPFMQNVSQMSIVNMIRLLSSNPVTQTDILLKQQYQAQIMAWRANPFDPHAIAAMRPRAYMLWTVMEYVTTLTDWGDYLFRQDTTESINEAINLYVLAQEILGKRPKRVSRPSPLPQCFNDIVNNLSAFSNVLVAFENNTPALKACSCDMNPAYMTEGAEPCDDPPALSTITDLLFCIPENPNVIALWDRVEDRLFKIRHCMNIEGTVRQLALFSPPIDPAMLVQAVAGGLSVADALSDLAAPLPHYRFSYLLQKANEFCGEVKGMGSQILGLLEKKDAEELSLFRQVHEQNILNITRSVKELALEDAKQNYETLVSSKNLIQIRLNDYLGREKISEREKNSIRLTKLSEGLTYAEQGVRLVAGLMHAVPDVHAGLAGVWGSPYVVSTIVGGSKIGSTLNQVATALGAVSLITKNAANMSSVYAGYDRRQEDWNLQIKSAREELLQVDRQLLSAQIKIKSAEKDLANHDVQTSQAKEMYDWLKNKYTNGNLYSWMLGQVKSVYKQAFDLAYNMAKRAQTCMDYELGISGTNIIQYGQWDSSKHGLLAGERLALQLRKLEDSYITKNDREYEITKNISLQLLDPLAVEELKSKGTCTFQLPDALYNLDYPGHYFRRIKSVSISIPCISGPHTSINAILALTKHTIRKIESDTSAITPQPFPGEKIATSSGQNDSGMFELNFRDERYLPFEGRGAVSEWTLELTDTFRQFDYSTISDVVIHMKYTARDAGSNGSLGSAMQGALKTYLDSLQQGLSQTQQHYAISLRHDLPGEWHEFVNNGSTEIQLSLNRLPYFMQALNPDILDLTFIAQSDAGTSNSIKIDGSTQVLMPAIALGLDTYKGSLGSGVSFGDTIQISEDSASDMKAIDVKDLIIAAKLKFL